MVTAPSLLDPSTAHDIRIRRYERGDEKQIVELLELVFNGWPHFDLQRPPIDHWNWKYIDNPMKLNNITLGLAGDQIVACDHGFFTNMKIGDEVSLVRQGTDAAVHPDYRGKGIYSKTAKLKDEVDREYRVKMVYYFSNVKLFKVSRMKNGRPVFPSPVKLLVRVSDVDNYVESNYRPNEKGILRTGLRLRKTLNAVKNGSSNQTKSSDSIQLLDVRHFGEEANVFWDKIKNDYKMITERSSEYLNWRYLDPRAGNFVVKAATENGELIGYIVLRIDNSALKPPRGYVVDLCTLKDRIDCASKLIMESSKYFDDNKITSAEYMILKGHPYERLFSKFGYIDSGIDNDLSYDLYRDGVAVDEVLKFRPGEALFQLGDTDW